MCNSKLIIWGWRLMSAYFWTPDNAAVTPSLAIFSGRLS